MNASLSSHQATFRDLLAAALRADPARPLVTFYDDVTGERVELSVTTYANWVAKTASLVQDELDVEVGELALVDLPTHWMGPVWLGALWSAGQVVTTDPSLAEEAALVVCGPAGVGRYGALAPSVPVVALSLRPLGAPFTEPLPPGVVDYGAVVLAQPDSFVPLDPPVPGDLAWRDLRGTTTQANLLGEATAPDFTRGGRLLTDVNPCSEDGLGTLLSPLVHSGGTVWVANPDEARWAQRRTEERVTADLRATPPG